MRIEKNEVIVEFENYCSDLKNKLRSFEDEVERLEKLVYDSEKGLGFVLSYIDSLKIVFS